MSETNTCTDVVELCALLQCLGFNVKYLEPTHKDSSQDGGARTVVVRCPTSGLHVVLESPGGCSCPASQQSSVWQVSGVAGGKHFDKEFGFGLLGSLPKEQRARLSDQLRDVIQRIMQQSEVDPERRRENKSASVTDLKTPEKMLQELPVDTPTRYRSLDTLTSKTVKESEDLPTPGVLQRSRLPSGCEDNGSNAKKKFGRQGTYTMPVTPDVTGDGLRRRNKTSSPIQCASHSSLLDTLVAAQKTAEELQKQLSSAINKLNEGNEDSSVSMLDVSKISLLKTECSKIQFSSSPNLSTIPAAEGLAKTRLKQSGSVSTSNLNQQLPSKEGKFSRLKRISPNIFKKSTPKNERQSLDGKSNMRSLLKSRIASPVCTPKGKPSPEPSSVLSRSKYGHIKSTIPRSIKKE